MARRDAAGLPRRLNPFIGPEFVAERVEKMKASIRAKVEHSFRVLKRQFGFIKVRYRGLAKEEALHDVPLYREFAKLGEGMSRLPDEPAARREHDPAICTSAGHGTTRSISSRNSRLRVFFLDRFRPSPSCFMTAE